MIRDPTAKGQPQDDTASPFGACTVQGLLGHAALQCCSSAGVWGKPLAYQHSVTRSCPRSCLRRVWLAFRYSAALTPVRRVRKEVRLSSLARGSGQSYIVPGLLTTTGPSNSQPGILLRRESVRVLWVWRRRWIRGKLNMNLVSRTVRQHTWSGDAALNLAFCFISLVLHGACER